MVRTRSSGSDTGLYTSDRTSPPPSTYRGQFDSKDTCYKSSGAGTVDSRSREWDEESDDGYEFGDSNDGTLSPVSETEGSLYDSCGVSATSTLPGPMRRTFSDCSIRGPIGRSCMSQSTGGSTGAGVRRRKSVVFRDLTDGLCEYRTISGLDSEEIANNRRINKASKALAKSRRNHGLD